MNEMIQNRPIGMLKNGDVVPVDDKTMKKLNEMSGYIKFSFEGYATNVRIGLRFEDLNIIDISCGDKGIFRIFAIDKLGKVIFAVAKFNAEKDLENPITRNPYVLVKLTDHANPL